ncbi:MAG: hypothetical protein K0U16_07570 [Gammaproteobacteria bacterium]|nr:hypothetical protein [Gammaproteobacteria bacterium]
MSDEPRLVAESMLLESQAREAELEKQIHALERQLAKRNARIEQLEGMINTPVTDDFIRGIRLEAAHQIERFGAAHDAGKTPPDWFWLLGYLAGKAVHAAEHGDLTKAKHHTISSAAALLNWHRHLSGETTIRPGINPPAE